MLRGGCIAFLVLSFAFIAFWTWARDDLFPMQLTQSAPLQGPNRAAAVVQFDLQNDGYHIIGVNARGKWRRWTAVVTQSEFPDPKWQLLWSRDGSLVALKQSAELWGDSRIKTALYTSAFDFKKNKSHESFDSLGVTQLVVWRLVVAPRGACVQRPSQRASRRYYKPALNCVTPIPVIRFLGRETK